MPGCWASTRSVPVVSTRDSHRVTGAALPAGHILGVRLETGSRAANLQQVSIMDRMNPDVIN